MQASDRTTRTLSVYISSCIVVVLASSSLPMAARLMPTRRVSSSRSMIILFSSLRSLAFSIVNRSSSCVRRTSPSPTQPGTRVAHFLQLPGALRPPPYRTRSAPDPSSSAKMLTELIGDGCGEEEGCGER